MKVVQNQIDISQKLKALPTTSGVYIMKDDDSNIIYIGKAKNLKRRVGSYFSRSQKNDKVSQMVSRVFSFDYILTKSELDALNLESNLIRTHKPHYNILLKEGKNNSFIKINLKKDLPTLEVTRTIKNDGAKYFGPYFQSFSAYQIVQIISSVFMLNDFDSSVSDKPYQRLWLNFFLGKVKRKDAKGINKKEYLQEVDKVIAFLGGDLNYATQLLNEKMQINAKMQNFERAIELRESIKLVEKLNSKVITELASKQDLDVFAYTSNGINSVVSVLVVRGGKMLGVNNYFVLDVELDPQEIVNNFILQYYPQNSTIPKEIVADVEIDSALLELLKKESGHVVKSVVPQRGIRKSLIKMATANSREYLQKNIDESQKQWQQTIGAMYVLKQDLNLKNLPARIECYDISNIQGTNIVASMVVFVGGMPLKKHYRKFKINTVSGENNDFESMKEVLTRRFSNLESSQDESFSKMPSLVVVDGGKGQLSYALEVIKNFNNVKSDVISLAERVDEIFVPNKKHSVYLSRENEGLKLLQRLRDEAHRFALSYHRQLRSKQMTSSQLEDIAGVGKQTAKKLITNFKSIKAIKSASVQELVSVGKVNKTIANNVYNYFNKSNE